jgi:branched-chain amino acid transport system substrate-binding protein
MKIKTGSSLSLFSLLAVLLLFGSGVPSPAFCQATLKVGALIPYAGRWGESGREVARGMLDSARWINQQGGVYGRRLEIVLIEDTSQLTETIAAYRKLNETDQIALLYTYLPETGLTLLPHIQLGRVPTFMGLLPAPYANPARTPFFFSVIPTPLDLARIALKFLAEQSGIKGRKPKMIFVGSPDYVDRQFLEEARSSADAFGVEVGPDVVLPGSFLSRGQDLMDKPPENIAALAEVINRFHPDYCYLSLTSREAQALLTVTKERGLKTKWIAGPRAFDENLASFEGVMGVQPVSPFGEDIPGMTGIVEAHLRWHPYDSHTLSFTEGWATVQIVTVALRRSLSERGVSREKLRSSLEGLDNYVMGGIVPPITITSRDHRPSMESRVLTVKGGKLIPSTSFISVGRDRGISTP